MAFFQGGGHPFFTRIHPFPDWGIRAEYFLPFASAYPGIFLYPPGSLSGPSSSRDPHLREAANFFHIKAVPIYGWE